MRTLLPLLASIVLLAPVVRGQQAPAPETENDDKAPSPGHAAHVVAADALLRLGQASEARAWLDKVPASERHFEWHYTAARADVSVQHVQLHTGAASALDVSFDGNRLATGGADGRLHILQAQSFMPLGSYVVGDPDAPTPIRDVALGANGREVVAGCLDGSLHAFDLTRAGLRWSVQAHERAVYSVDVSPDGSRIVTTSWKRVPGSPPVLGLTSVFDAHDGTRLADLDGTAHPTSACAFSPDGTRLATGGWGFRVRVWDAQTFEPQLDIELSEDDYAAVQTLAWDARGTRLVIGTKDDHAYVYDAEDGRLLTTLSGHGGWVEGADFSADSVREAERLVTGSIDGALRVFETTRGEWIATLYGTRGPVTDVDFLHDGSFVSTSGDGSLRKWDTAAYLRRQVPLPTGSATHSLAYNGTGQFLASASHDSEIRIWDTRAGTLHQRLVGHEGSANAVVFFHDGLLASGSNDGTVRVWSLEPEMETGVLDTGGSAVTGLAGLDCLLFGATRSGKIILWDHCPKDIFHLSPDKWTDLGRELTLDSPAYSLAVAQVQGTPAEYLLVAGCNDGSIRLWKVPSFEAVGVLEGHTAVVSGLAVHGDQLASASQDGTVRLWDLESRSARATLEGHRAGVFRVAFSPDGKRLTSGGYDNTVRLWDVASGETVLVVPDLDGGIFALAFHPDGSQLAVGRTEAVQILDGRLLSDRE